MAKMVYDSNIDKTPLKGIKNVAIYVRKSRMTLGLDEHETLESHRRELIGFAEDNNLNYILFEEVETGTSDDRIEFLRMLSLIENLAFDALLSVHIDRLLRNDLDKARLNKALVESDTLIVQTNPFEVINLNNDTDYEKVAFRSFFAEHEARQIKRRFKAGKVRAALQGKWIHMTPYGYEIGEDGHLKIVQEEAIVLQEIAERYINGEVPRVFAYDLNKRGILSPKGSVWRDKTIRVMLANEVYIGVAIYGKARYPKRGKKVEKPPEEIIRFENAHPPIFDQVTWNKIRSETNKRKSTGRSIIGTHIYSGLLKCAVCGKALHISTVPVSGGKKKIRISKCANRDSHGVVCNNKGTGVYEDALNVLMYNLLKTHYGDLIKPINGDDKSTEKLLKEKKRIATEIKRVENAKIRVLELYEYGDIDRRTYNARVEERDVQLEDLQIRLAKLDTTTKKEESIEEQIEALEQALKLFLLGIGENEGTTHTQEERKALNGFLRAMIEKISLIRIGDEVNIGIDFK